ncbi:hypothetical protein PV518_47025, partial [Streptomyces sp. ND04-05B]|nr:hypothetical protein [Streptomyces sp. ND04-05B]
MSGFAGLGENIRAAGLLAPSDTCLRPHPGRPLSPVEQPIRPHRAGRRTVGFWLIATLATLGEGVGREGGDRAQRGEGG